MARLETYVQASLSKTKYFKCKIKQTCNPKCKNDQWAPTSLPRAVTASSMSAGSNTSISSSTCNMKPNTRAHFHWCIYLTAKLKPHHNHLCNASKFTDAMKFWALSMRNYKTLWRTVLYQGLWYAWWILFNLTLRFTRLLVCYNLQEFWTKNFLQLNNSITVRRFEGFSANQSTTNVKTMVCMLLGACCGQQKTTCFISEGFKLGTLRSTLKVSRRVIDSRILSSRLLVPITNSFLPCQTSKSW